MYKPSFNTILVELQADEWGGGNDDSMLGKSYREGVVVSGQKTPFFATKDYPISPEEIIPLINELEGKHIMFNEGVEAGTVHEEDGKLYGFIYWWDVRGVRA